eukprot:s781_g22.t3
MSELPGAALQRERENWSADDLVQISTPFATRRATRLQQFVRGSLIDWRRSADGLVAFAEQERTLRCTASEADRS